MPLLNRTPEKYEARALEYERKNKPAKAIKNREKAARLRAQHGGNTLGAHPVGTAYPVGTSYPVGGTTYTTTTTSTSPILQSGFNNQTGLLGNQSGLQSGLLGNQSGLQSGLLGNQSGLQSGLLGNQSGLQGGLNNQTGLLGNVERGLLGNQSGLNNQTGLLGNQSGLQSGLLGNQSGLQSGLLGNQSGLQSGLLGNQSGLQSGLLGNQSGLQSGLLGNQSGLQGGLLGNQSGLQSGILGNQQSGLGGQQWGQQWGNRTPAIYEQNALKWEQRGNWTKAQKNREKYWRMQNPQWNSYAAPQFYQQNRFLGYNQPYGAQLQKPFNGGQQFGTGFAQGGQHTVAPIVEQVVRPTIVEQTMRAEKITEVQPIIHREIDQTQVRVLEKHLYETVPSAGPHHHQRSHHPGDRQASHH